MCANVLPDALDALAYVEAMPTSRRRATSSATIAPAVAFGDEASMMGPLRSAAVDLCVDPNETWVMLNEHVVETRIPDLVAARLDVGALNERLSVEAVRVFTESELRILGTMQFDRQTTDGQVAEQLRMPVARVRPILKSLEVDGYVARAAQGAYVQRLRVRPIVNYVVSFEAKRSDWHTALVQARAHQAFADAAYVAFDAVFAPRFARAVPSYERLGVGLLSIRSDGLSYQRMLRGTRSLLQHPITVALNAERVLGRLLGHTVSQLPQSRLPGASAGSANQEPPQLLGRASRMLEKLLGARARSSPGSLAAH